MSLLLLTSLVASIPQGPPLAPPDEASSCLSPSWVLPESQYPLPRAPRDPPPFPPVSQASLPCPQPWQRGRPRCPWRQVLSLPCCLKFLWMAPPRHLHAEIDDSFLPIGFGTASSHGALKKLFTFFFFAFHFVSDSTRKACLFI